MEKYAEFFLKNSNKMALVDASRPGGYVWNAS
jgi:hypothetical protein